MTNLAPESTAPQREGTAPSANISRCFNDDAWQDELWQNALEAVGPLDIHPNTAHFLQAWIAMGVERMRITGRVLPHDLAIARANIRTFIHLMKTEAVRRGHAGRLDSETLRAAHRTLERKGLLTTFTLWPFWPNEFVSPL